MDLFLGQSSDSFSLTHSTTTPYSDEEVVLAISRPKKRTGRKIFKETRHPVYRGVRRRNGDKWVCELREPNKKSRIWLGTYPTPEMAARAHDVAALTLRGKSACLNFADSAWRLPVPASSHAAEIRRVAGQAAELFRPRSFNDVEDCFSESCSEKCKDLKENVLVIDEEEVFDMPRLLAEMAQGLLISPPVFNGDCSNQWSLLENDFFDVSLWSN